MRLCSLPPAPRQRAQSVVEIALCLPLVVLMLVAGVDLARAYAIQLSVGNAAHTGAESAVLDMSPTLAETSGHVSDELGEVPGMRAADATVTQSFTLSDGSSVCVGAADTTAPGTSTVADPCYANVRVRYTFSTLVAWPGVAPQHTIDRTVKVRRYQ